MRQHTTTALACTLFAAASALAGGDLSNQSQSPDMGATADPVALDLNTQQGPFGPPDYFSRDDYRQRWANFDYTPPEQGEEQPSADLDAQDDSAHQPQDGPHTPGHDDGKPGATTNGGDLDDSNTVDVADLVAMIMEWGVCPVTTEVCRGDLTGDGFIDVQDLVALIVQWD
jgi:hypothetical protein